MDAASLPDWASSLVEPDRSQARRLPYRTYRDTWSRVATALTAAEPERRARAASWGTSHGGEPIWAIDVPPGGASPPRNTVLVVAGIHAMEHVGVATAVALIERALSPASPWREHRLVVLPMGNPDGFLAVEGGLARGDRRFRRANAGGVDLNRNFAVGWDDRYFWNRILGRIFSPGSGPLSEPETRAIDALAGSVRPTHAVSLHAFGEWIFLPYAGSRRTPPHLEEMLVIARRMVAAQPERPYRVRQLGRRTRLFQARGAEIDHFYERHGALSFLVEIGAGPRLRVPRTWFHPYTWFTPPAPLAARDVANVVPAIESLASL